MDASCICPSLCVINWYRMSSFDRRFPRTLNAKNLDAFAHRVLLSLFNTYIPPAP